MAPLTLCFQISSLPTARIITTPLGEAVCSCISRGIIKGVYQWKKKAVADRRCLETTSMTERTPETLSLAKTMWVTAFTFFKDHSSWVQAFYSLPDSCHVHAFVVFWLLHLHRLSLANQQQMLTWLFPALTQIKWTGIKESCLWVLTLSVQYAVTEMSLSVCTFCLLQYICVWWWWWLMQALTLEVELLVSLLICFAVPAVPVPGGGQKRETESTDCVGKKVEKHPKLQKF